MLFAPVLESVSCYESQPNKGRGERKGAAPEMM